LFPKGNFLMADVEEWKDKIRAGGRVWGQGSVEAEREKGLNTSGTIYPGFVEAYTRGEGSWGKSFGRRGERKGRFAGNRDRGEKEEVFFLFVWERRNTIGRDETPRFERSL